MSESRRLVRPNARPGRRGRGRRRKRVLNAQLGIKGDGSTRPVVDANAQHIPEVAHVLGLRVEVAVNGLGHNLKFHALATPELLSLVRGNGHVERPLLPGPVTAHASLRRGAGAAGRRVMQVGSGEGFASIQRELDAANATASAGPRDAAHRDVVGVHARHHRLVGWHADDGLHRQRLDHWSLVDTDAALALGALRVHVLPVVHPRHVGCKMSVKTRAGIEFARLC
mmetsp:Transcript_32792/g.74939  ORF Transcript_32792/g.74939 Transcript_32792/m.74939 type:complete len:226 (-) Transcript_32792:1228-1905(-)